MLDTFHSSFSYKLSLQTLMASTFSSCLIASNSSFDIIFFGGTVLKDFSFLLALLVASLLKQRQLIYSKFQDF